jgi:hypothetical protein
MDDRKYNIAYHLQVPLIRPGLALTYLKYKSYDSIGVTSSLCALVGLGPDRSPFAILKCKCVIANNSRRSYDIAALAARILDFIHLQARVSRVDGTGNVRL